ncbi:hypothetical protein C5167_007511 [Papaver somniferum]|nr:hypothetical protein C5167_007511 [Papaver somniferum]
MYYKHTVDQYESDLLFVAHSLVLSINEKDLHIVKPFPCNGSCIRFYLKFQLVLWGLKLWARRRGIYCNLVGFFGGIHLAVLTTFICCRFPNASGTTLISRFFETYTFWPWPTPVMLQGDLDAMALVAANKGNPMQEIVEQVRDRSTVFTCFQNSGLFKFLLLEFRHIPCKMEAQVDSRYHQPSQAKGLTRGIHDHLHPLSMARAVHNCLHRSGLCSSTFAFLQ